MNIEAELERAAACLDAAEALLITAGAGMGVDSGLPDFRGVQGFWRAYPAIARLGLSFEEVANPTWFRADPALAWAFYGHRLNLYRSTVPHGGFGLLRQIGASMPLGCFVFTSNVDGQFQKAGFLADQIVECHGSIHHFQCAAGCSEEIWEASGENVALDHDRFRALEPWPKCGKCMGLARPNILMFNDGSWLRHRTEEQWARLEVWLDTLASRSARLVVVEAGAGSAIPTVRLTSEQIAERHGGTLIRINPREAEVPSGHIGLPLGAAEGIRRVYVLTKVGSRPA